MAVPTPTNLITQPFGSAALAGDITLPIPVPTQFPANPGRASYVDGFPQPNFLPTSAGGIPPSGKDFNGIFYTITAYLAALQAGQPVAYNATVQTAIGGYALGAILQKAADPSAYWISVTANNVTDPDTGGAGWMSTVPLYKDDTTLLGAVNNYVLPGASDYTLDIDTTAGNVNITGFVSQRHNQTLYISNIGTNILTIDALNGGSLAANQVRAQGDFAFPQYGTMAIRYSAGVSKWLVV